MVMAATACAQPRGPVTSHIVIVDRGGRNERVVFSSPLLFEAPNWSPDGKYLLLNSEGRLWRLSLMGGSPEPVDTGSVKGINNDHGISPDGRWFAISAGQIYILPSSGGAPRQITSRSPSYFHGWSPDGKTLTYCAPRNGNFDLYAIQAKGGEEVRLTTSPGYDDGPDYSPDGRWIWFNSDRSGNWDIWRIPATGAGPGDVHAQRITTDDYEDWFPHPSPDGKWVVFLSFEKGTKGHPPNRDVVLRLISVRGGTARVVAKLFGGQGSLNVNSWSPDSRRFAYVRYEPRPTGGLSEAPGRMLSARK